jgi:hypothetical protein
MDGVKGIYGLCRRIMNISKDTIKTETYLQNGIPTLPGASTAAAWTARGHVDQCID